MFQLYTKYLSMVCMVVTFNIFGASEEATRLLETAGTRDSAAPVASMEIVNNLHQNIAVFRQLGLIGATGDDEIDMKAFPYLRRLMQGGSPERTEEEVLAMNLTREGESKAIEMYSVAFYKLRDGDYVSALRCLLRAEMQGEETAGSILQRIFEDPAKYKTSNSCIVHMIHLSAEGATLPTTSKEVTSLKDLLAPCSLLADAYKMRAKGFIMLRDNQWRAYARKVDPDPVVGKATVGTSIRAKLDDGGAAAGAGSSTSARGSLGGDATIRMPADSSSGDEAETRGITGKSNALEDAATIGTSLAGGTTAEEGIRQRRSPAAPA